MNEIELSPELVRMAQVRATTLNFGLPDELARLIVEESVARLDPELGVLLDAGTMSQSDNLVAALGVNDVVINGHRFDVRALSADGAVTVRRTLTGSQYLSLGTLVVALSDNTRGSVVAFVGAGSWMRAEERDKNELVEVRPEILGDFDFATALSVNLAKPVIKLPAVGTLADPPGEITALLEKREMISARRKQIFAYLCANWSPALLEQVEAVSLPLNDGALKPVLHGAGKWQGTVEMLCDRIEAGLSDSEKNGKLDRDQIRRSVLKTGELYGSEFRSPAFRKHLLEAVTKARLEESKISSRSAVALFEQVAAGASPLDVVRRLVNNKTAVDLACVIKQQRDKVSGFVAASAEEIGMAFKQLALQPAYATHSAENSGVDSINEALALLEVSEMAERASALDKELTSL